jgi:hypothetical protein
MSVNRQEYPHNTPEQVRAYLASALALVAELDVPDDLRVAAFSKAAELLSSKQVVLVQPQFGVPGLPDLGRR